MNTENTWVFLSHSNKDFSKLTIVRNKLEKLGYRPLLFFLKCLENDREIRELIYREIDARERFILCQSKNSIHSPWVELEVEYIKRSGRPYEVIDLDASNAAIDAAIMDFNRRSTSIVWSTENTVAKELVNVLEAKAFKAINLKEIVSGGTSSSIQGIENYVKENRDTFEKSYFIVLASRKLNEEETRFLNGLVGECKLNAFVFNVEHCVDKDYFSGLKSFKKLEGNMSKCMAEKIVKHLIDWDVSRYNENPAPDDGETSQKQQVIDALRQLGGYAKLKDLYNAVDTSSWSTKTPQATIRRILQNSEETFMIKRGIWGLKEVRNQIEKQLKHSNQ